VAKRKRQARYLVIQEWDVTDLSPLQRRRLVETLTWRGLDGAQTAEHAPGRLPGTAPLGDELVVVHQPATRFDSRTKARESVCALVQQVCVDLSYPQPVLEFSQEVRLDRAHAKGAAYLSPGWEPLPRTPTPVPAPLPPVAEGEGGDPPEISGVREPRRPKPNGPPPAAAARELPAT
jgi:hypothetical protein